LTWIKRPRYWPGFIAAIGSGIVAGIFFAFSSFVMAGLGRIPPVQGIAAMNSINVTVINPSFMSAFLGTGILCLVVGVRSLFLWNQGAKLVIVASLLYLVGSFGVTLVFNVPLNNKLASIADPAQAVAFWPNYLAAWYIWNYVRTAAAALSAVLFTAVLCRR
jgi:uncharacterized membrane protein